MSDDAWLTVVLVVVVWSWLPALSESSATEWCDETDGERELREEQARAALEACPVFRQVRY